MNCIEHTTIPELPSDPCNGKRYNTQCVYSSTAFTLLSLPADSNLETILNAFVLALNANNTRLNEQDVIIAALEEQITTLEERVTALEV